jgi:antitoxin component YwqK of YwqJK toxin-antitoxin module
LPGLDEISIVQTQNGMKSLKILFSIAIALTVTISCSSKNEEINFSDTPYLIFDENGRLKESGLRVENKLDGSYYWFLESGEKYCEYTVKDGKLEGVQKWFVDGKVNYIETYKDGLKEGKAISYNPRCGYIEEESEYRKNLKHGLWYIYKKKRLFMVEFYRNDSLIEIVYQNPDFEHQKYSIEDAPPPTEDEDC